MYAIRKTYGPIASGTKVELVDPNRQGFDKIASERGGYVTVKLVSFGKKFREQNHPLVSHLEATNGAFDIEADNVVKLRDTHVPASTK